jgi:hypothetical protein
MSCPCCGTLEDCGCAFEENSIEIIIPCSCGSNKCMFCCCISDVDDEEIFNID